VLVRNKSISSVALGKCLVNAFWRVQSPITLTAITAPKMGTEKRNCERGRSTIKSALLKKELYGTCDIPVLKKQ
jgi:hypothetical protein